MPVYNYRCIDCEQQALEQHDAVLVRDSSGDAQLPKELYDEFVLFETSHSVKANKAELRAATECPRCNGHNCERTLYGTQIHSYMRGYGWQDRAGIRRDMHKFKVQNEDPYAQYRAPGEVDHIKDNLDKSGRPDPGRKHYLVSHQERAKRETKEINAAVRDIK